MPQISDLLVHANANLPTTDSDSVQGGFRTKVDTADALSSISVSLLKAYASFVFVDSDNADEGWYYYIGDGTTNVNPGEEGATWEKLNDLFGGGALTGIVANSSTSNTATVAFTGSEGISVGFQDGTPDTIDIELTNGGSLTDNNILKWDSDTPQIVSSVISESDAGDIDMGDGSVTISTLNVTTINATNSYTAASISTSDTFIRLADPSANFSDAGAGVTQEIYANAQHAGFVINTGYYDNNASGSTGMQFSTHKLLYWNKTLLKWVVQDGTPELDTNTDPDTLINAEQDFSSGVGRMAGTMKFVENFFVPDAQALHFGLDAIFSFDHFNGSDDPSVTATTDEFIKTQYVVDPKTLFEFASFNQAAADIDGGANGHQNNRSWQIDTVGEVDDDAANIMSNTFLRTARMFKAKVVLEAEDILTSGTDKKIKVYHGGVFNGARELPVVKVYRKSSGTSEGADFVYEEIMVKVLITDNTDYFEIVFNPGFLVADTTLYVRAVY
tara:strand:- start:8081 stop:9583 length:1503 start_codon:yes stop_codon:yes gene_type:complete